MERTHGSLRKELKVKTPWQALNKWFQIEPEIFRIKPKEFLKNNMDKIKKDD